MIDQATAANGTARKVPTMPPRIVPAVKASKMTSSCSRSDLPSTIGARRLPSNWLTATTTATTMSAVTRSFVTSATRAATMPATVAPTIGMNAPTKTMNASGRAKGTCRIHSATPITIASTAATIAVPLT